ncbi:MAG: GIY-YIG nuclease family protein [Dokdonella sp.]
MEEPIWRTLSKGRCFVYVLACREQDSLKIGYARDPWARLRAFHPHFHAFFDLDRSALIETDRVDEARAIEKTLKHGFSSASEIAPLQVRERAGGKFEWFRGIHAQAI